MLGGLARRSGWPLVELEGKSMTGKDAAVETVVPILID